MRVQARLFGSLARFLPPGSAQKRAIVDLDYGATVDDLAQRLGMADLPSVVLVNDEPRHRTARLQEGDVISFFPPLGGGRI